MPAAPADCAHPDAHTLALCAQLEAAQRRLNGMWLQGTGPRFFDPASYIEDDKEREAVCAPLEAEIDDLFGRIVEGCVTTLDGFRAVARCLVLNEPNLRHNRDDLRDDLDFSSPGEHALHWLINGLSGGEISPDNCMADPGQVRL